MGFSTKLFKIFVYSVHLGIYICKTLYTVTFLITILHFTEISEG